MRFRRRVVILYVAFLLALGGVLLRTIWMQTVDRAEWEQAAWLLRARTEVLQAPRGRILDRRGRPLAYDQATLQLAVLPWDLLGNRSGRCTECGLVRSWRPRLYPDDPAPSHSRICSCQVEACRGTGRKPDPTIVDLPPPDYTPLDEALGLEPGTLLARGQQRIQEIYRLTEGFRRALEADGIDLFLDTRERAFLEDMLRRPYVLETGIGDDVARLLLTDEQEAFRGFLVRHDLRRRAAFGEAAPHLIGYATKVVNLPELEKLQERVPKADGDTRIGRTGVERALDDVLQGRPGRQVLLRDEDGHFTRVLEEQRPVPGQDVTLALDVTASEKAREVLVDVATREKYHPNARPSGALVMMDAETGEILVWAEIPGFDLQSDVSTLFTDLYSERTPDRERREWLPIKALPPGLDLATWRDRLSAPIGPGVSRVSQIAIEPGSTFKTFVALGLLGTGYLRPEWHFSCNAHAGGPGCHGCGDVDLVAALEHSCNKYFAHWVRYGEDPSQTGARLAALGRFLPRFGFGSRPDPSYPEWHGGTWLAGGYDFSLAQVVAGAQDDLRARRDDDTKGPRPLEITLDFQPDRNAPGAVGGNPAAARKLVAEAARLVAEASGASRVRVGVTAEENLDRDVTLLFDVRAATPASWTVLPSRGAATLPPSWDERVGKKRAGVTGDPARGGTVWFRLHFRKGLGRTTPEAEASIHAYDASSVAIGQGPVLATPLQMARAMCAIANGGYLPVPQPVHAVDGRPWDARRQDLHLDPEHLAVVREGMLAVTSADGTARNAGFENVPGIVYGKTGTAQLGPEWRPWTYGLDERGRRDEEAWHHWFAGFAEAPGRRTVAFACVLHAREEPAAAMTSAKAVAQFLTWWFGS
ncbi:MAG: penicillin-binding transpeptidase domain-containing protein [Planctomycetota bacterium]